MSSRVAAWFLNFTCDWRLWASLLAALYLSTAIIGLQRPLMGTEVWALYFATQPIGEQFAEIQHDLVHPPLMYLIERLWLGLFGGSDTAAKLLVVPINVATIFLFTWLANRVVTQWRLASFLFALVYLRSGGAVSLVRMYGLLVLWVVLAIIVWDSWRRRPTVGRLGLWTAVMVLMIYTHYAGMLVLAAFLVANWMLGPRRIWFTAAAALAGISFVAWALFVMPVLDSRGIETNLWWVRLLLPRPHEALAMLLYEQLGAFTHERPWIFGLAIGAGVVHLALLVPALRGIRRLWPPRVAGDERRRWFWLAVMLAGVPVALLLIFSVGITTAFAPRFLTCILPAYWILLVMLAELGGRPGRFVLRGIVLPWALLAALISFGSLSSDPTRLHTSVVAAEAEPADLVLCEDCNEVYWEVLRRHGAEVRIHALPRDNPENGVDLTVVPRRPLSTTGLAGTARVWYFNQQPTIPEQQSRVFEEAGFEVAEVRGPGPPWLTRLEREE